MESANVDPNDAYCTECKTWYRLDKRKEVDKHRH